MLTTRTLYLPPEVDARVQAEAAKQSLPVEDYLLRLVADAVSMQDAAARREHSPRPLGSAPTRVTQQHRVYLNSSNG